MIEFVRKSCVLTFENESQKKSAVHLLRALNLEDMESIMNDSVCQLPFLCQPFFGKNTVFRLQLVYFVLILTAPWCMDRGTLRCRSDKR